MRSSTGKPINHKCVQRLMQSMGLRALISVKKRIQGAAGLIDAQVPNVLVRDFSHTAPDPKLATEITEFNVAGQKLYLSACMGLYNGETIAHQLARRRVFELVSGTLRAALSQSKPLSRLTVHSD